MSRLYERTHQRRLLCLPRDSPVPLPDQRLVQSHQGGVHRDGHHGQVEIVEHDGNVVVQPSAGVEVQTQRAAADHGDGWDIPQPARERGLQRAGKG